MAPHPAPSAKRSTPIKVNTLAFGFCGPRPPLRGRVHSRMEVHIRWNVALLLLSSCSTRCQNTDVVHGRVRGKGNSCRIRNRYIAHRKEAYYSVLVHNFSICNICEVISVALIVYRIYQSRARVLVLCNIFNGKKLSGASLWLWSLYGAGVLSDWGWFWKRKASLKED